MSNIRQASQPLVSEARVNTLTQRHILLQRHRAENNFYII
jgi:hypothetical protein